MEKVGITSITASITKPTALNVESLDFRKLTLMTGLNGTGKTLLLVYGYVFTEVAGMYVATKLTGDAMRLSAQYIMEKCFTEIDTTGTMSGLFGEGRSITFCMEDGKIKSMEIAGFDDVGEVMRINYMSSALRTFDSMRAYLQLRKVSIERFDDQTREKIFEVMLGTYRLYDVAYMEKLIAAMPLNIDPMLQVQLHTLGVEEKVDRFEVDLERSDFYLVNADGTRKPLTAFSKGHQSILNMVIGQSL